MEQDAFACVRQHHGTARWTRRMLGPFVGEWDEGLLRGFDGDKVHALVAHVAMCVDRPWTRPTVAEHWGDVDAVVHGGVGAPVLEADAGVLRRLRRRGAGCNQVR